MLLNLHLPTLLTLSMAINLVIGGLLWAVYHLRERQECFRLWAIACAAFASGTLLASAQVVIDAPFVTVFLAHMSLSASPLLVLAGIHSLMGFPALGAARSARLLKLSIVAYLVLMAGGFQSDPLIAQMFTALFSALLFSLAIYRLSTIRRKLKLSSRILQLLFTIHGALMVVQILAISADLLGLLRVDVSAVLTPVLANHLLLATATVMALPLLAFTQAEMSLRYLAERDEHTQLFNRRAFYQRGVAAFDQARLQKQSLTVLMIDLDYFKKINDRWGHAVGIEAGQQGRVMAEELRDADIVARIGGEEFAAVLNTGNREDIEVVTVRLHDAIVARGRYLNGMPLNISASIGGAACYRSFDRFTDLVDAADKALYEAKRKGRNRVELHSMATPVAE